MYFISETNSSLIKAVKYDDEQEELTIAFHKYYIDEVTFIDVPMFMYTEFISTPSLGKFYLALIKNNFKTKNTVMAETNRPKTVNKCSKEKRYIKIRINVLDINKDWLFVGEKGTYLDMTLALLPDEELDKYGNLGMITQTVPKDVFDKEKSLPADKRSRGPILGNGAEFERTGAEGAPGGNAGTQTSELDAKKKEELMEDLPF